MIEITLKIDTQDIERAVGVAWSREFVPPDNTYRSTNTGGTGWQEVQRQVRTHIETLDMTDFIVRSAKAQLAGVIDEVVTSALRERAKALTKTMVKNGDLLGGAQ